MLGELHRVVPDSEYSQAGHLIVSSSKSNNPKTGHRRWSSLDMVSGDQGSLQLLEKEPGVLSEPQVAAEAAKIFSRRVSRRLAAQCLRIANMLHPDASIFHVSGIRCEV